jgi:hypothetical protein
MNNKTVILSLLLVVFGYRNQPNTQSARTDRTLSREKTLKKAEAWVRKADNLEEDVGLQIDYDDGNKEWRVLLKELGRDDPHAAKFFDKMLRGRDYQSVLVGRTALTLDGTYCVLIDRKTGEVTTFIGGSMTCRVRRGGHASSGSKPRDACVVDNYGAGE